ncbi:MAG: gamma-glutamyl-gamma-aminobutyrate hydrolase family protein [Trueperaceae bacterium]
MDRPRILLTTSTVFRDDGLRREDSLTGRNYSEAVALAGGLPLMVASLDADLAESYLDSAAGVLFTGGVDVDPAFYGEQPEPGLGRVDLQRDAFELALYRAARSRGIPVLGVCRGIQLMNVAEGGTLLQHLPDLPQAIQHTQVDIGGAPSHTVILDPSSRLAGGLGRGELRANSYHHQAIDRLAEGFRAVGRTADGLIEAIENTEGSPVLGVQWHPEMSFKQFPENLLPFRWLAEEAGRRRSVAIRG